MKREIKFRVWDKDIFKMLYGSGLGVQSGTNMLWCTNGELMQYTGLKDKNGKEIYEGDIIQQQNRNSNFVGIYKVVLSNIRNHCGWHLRGKSRSGGQGHYTEWNPETKEIIGNIYENPELLQ